MWHTLQIFCKNGRQFMKLLNRDVLYQQYVKCKIKRKSSLCGTLCFKNSIHWLMWKLTHNIVNLQPRKTLKINWSRRQHSNINFKVLFLPRSKMSLFFSVFFQNLKYRMFCLCSSAFLGIKGTNPNPFKFKKQVNNNQTIYLFFRMFL